jgi:hypothetical protein
MDAFWALIYVVAALDVLAASYFMWAALKSERQPQ